MSKSAVIKVGLSNFIYKMTHTALSSVNKDKDLSVTATSDLKLSEQCLATCSKVTKCWVLLAQF